MPFARPSSSPSGGTSYTSPLPNGSNALQPAKLATPWDASSMEKQLEMMKQEAAASSSASSMSFSPARPPLASLPRSQASPNINGIATAPRDMASPDSQAMSSSSSSSPPEHYFTSHRALKQRLFQMSDDEDEGEEGENASTKVANSSNAESSSSYHSRFRADRSHPIRQSISALSGVTVIGRGSIGSKRDSQGSISTIGSKRNSLEEARPGAMWRTQSDNVTAPMSTSAKREAQEPQPQQTNNTLDMPSALNLLQMYPRAASPPRNFNDQASQMSARSRSVSPHSYSPRSQASVPLPGSTEEGGSRPVRRHSRSSMASDLLISPVTSSLTMTAPNSAREQDITSSIHSPLDAFVFANQHDRSAETSPFSTEQHVSPASLPEASSSRTLASTSADGDSPRSRRVLAGSRSISTNDLAQIMRSFSSRSRKATGRRRSTQGQDIDEAGPSTTTTMPTSASADPVRGTSTRGSRQPSNSAKLKELIRQKRRMASAPFHNSPSLHTSGTTSPIMASGAQSPVSSVAPEPPAWDPNALRRARSRRSSAASTGLNLNFTSNGFQEARMRALRGMGDVVMTPSVEEWKSLGLDESLNDRNGSESSGSESDTSSSESSHANGEDSDDVPARLRKVSKKNDDTASVGSDYRPRLGSITAFNQYYGSAPPAASESSAEPPDPQSTSLDGSSFVPVLSRSSSRILGLNNKKKRASRDLGSEADTSSALDDGSGSDSEALPMNHKSSIPMLSRQSLSMPAGSNIPGLDTLRQIDGNADDSMQAPTPIRKTQNGLFHPSLSGAPAPAFSPSRTSSPIPLAQGGPADPRAYSAVTGLRNIDSFVVQGEAGKGAYGLVRKVREKGPDGRPTGPSLMLKYIVKQRILADAYKRHKVLGVIPMEIHVLDFIRRIYRGPGQPSRDPVSQLKKLHGIPPPTAPSTAEQAANQTLYGHPNLCQMLDFFEDAENYYLVMSCFGNGQDLFDYVDAAPMGLSITESQAFLIQIVDAVAFLHSHGVVHRDIKDENVILDGKGGVQLIDFGSAAYIKEGKPYFDTFSGTLDFASPEVLRGERYGGKETDIWALGVLAYVIFCGECPFWSSEESLSGPHAGCRSEAALQAKADSPEVQAELHATGSSIDPQDAVDFVHQCLQVHARERPPAVHLRKHRFISGKTGWVGVRGWEVLDGYSSAASGFDST